MKIYLAGKITHNGWRNTIFNPTLYPTDDYVSDYPDVVNMRRLDKWPVFSNAMPGDHDYVGPYFIGDDHGCAHGTNTHGVAAGKMDSGCLMDSNPSQKKTVDLCRKALNDCDLVFAWIDSSDCHGTIAELGYASGIGKSIHIAGPKKIDDLWFVYNFCSSGKPDFSHPDAKSAFDWYINVGNLKFMPYQNYLKTEHWLNFRKEALLRANNHCQVCNSTMKLQVHHRTYQRRGEELPEDVIVLCDDCHGLFHANGKLA